MDFQVFDFLFTSLIIFIFLYIWKSWKIYNYWKDRGIPGPTPVPIFGNFAKVFFNQLSHIELFNEWYDKWRDQPFIGFYKGHTPMLLMFDLELAKHVMIKDFNVFSSRGLQTNEKIDPLSPHLFVIDGIRWKSLRSKLSPIFTSGKLKHMFDLVLECSDAFEIYLNNKIGNEKSIECREIAAKYTTDVIGSCAFGISMNALNREDSEFRKIGRKIFPSSYSTVFIRHIIDAAPALHKLLKIRLFSKEVSDFFISSMKETIEFRQKENFVRNDLVDLLIEIKKNHNNDQFELTDELLTAQAFVFFVAGFHTSSLTISYALYELAYEPEIQEKLRNEILEILKQHEGKISYEVLKDLKYLEKVFEETLRKNPILIALERQNIQPYKIPGTNVILDPGTKVYVPNYAFQHDPKYFPNPDVFDPERFSDQAKSLLHPMVYLPFGDGPKNCIGNRFASITVKLALIKILKNYRIKTTEMSRRPYELDKGAFLLVPKNGIQLKFEFISKDLNQNR